jgi:hypothetical protein
MDAQSVQRARRRESIDGDGHGTFLASPLMRRSKSSSTLSTLTAGLESLTHGSREDANPTGRMQ